MTEIEAKREELDRLIAAKEFRLTDGEVLKKALEFEKGIKNTGSC
ncbi:MAG: Spo0E family sporulation regulatory protein-aspartic acid phosphatase [Clostridia bacterium]|nr:Spo0E family sporulation regulatory protein-aspartic acid phosphatase [Clostridia bacterium]